MSKRTVFTTVTPLPAGITRETVMSTLRDHLEMVDLNPLVEERHPIKPPPNATAEEYHCQWYALTDRVTYLPGVKLGKVSYNVCFHDLEVGLQTHCYAPLGLTIKGKWTLGGSLPGEPVAPVELGVGAPLEGLWLREDVDMKCNIMMTKFVKKTLKKSHASLVERLIVKSKIVDASIKNQRLNEKSLSSQHHHHTPSRSSTQYSQQSQHNSMHSAPSIVEDIRHSPPPQQQQQHVYTPYRPQGHSDTSPPPSGSFRHDLELPDFREKTTYEDPSTSLYPKPLSSRSSSSTPSWHESLTGSQKGLGLSPNPNSNQGYDSNSLAARNANPNANAGARVSWNNLNVGINPQRSPSILLQDSEYRNANPYRNSAQGYQAVVLENGFPAAPPTLHGPVELE